MAASFPVTGAVGSRAGAARVQPHERLKAIASGAPRSHREKEEAVWEEDMMSLAGFREYRGESRAS
jgi:hypothetical protein